MNQRIQHEIIGSELQALKVILAPGESVIGENGAMLAMGHGVDFKASFGAGDDKGMAGKLFGAGKRMLTKEKVWVAEFKNNSNQTSGVLFSAPFAGKIIHLDLQQLGGEVWAQKGAFLAATHGVDVGIAFNKKIGAGLFGGEGFVMQAIRGNGEAFIHVGGTVVEMNLAPGETLKVDTGCLAAFQPSVKFDIHLVKGLATMAFAGEGLVLAELCGPGKVWIQTLPLADSIDLFLSHVPKCNHK